MFISAVGLLLWVHFLQYITSSTGTLDVELSRMGPLHACLFLLPLQALVALAFFRTRLVPIIAATAFLAASAALLVAMFASYHSRLGDVCARQTMLWWSRFVLLQAAGFVFSVGVALRKGFPLSNANC